MATPLLTVKSVHPAHILWKQAADRVNTTPGLLRVGLVGICLLAALFSFTVWQGATQHRQAIKTVEEDSAPSIIAAQDIKAELADMHSNAANELLMPPWPAEYLRLAAGGSLLGSVEPQAVLDYWRRRAKVNANLKTAAKNITYDDENAPVLALLNGLGKYDDAIGRARALHQHGDNTFLMEHRRADSIMRTVLLPAADKLTTVNQDELNKGYQSERSSSNWAKGRMLLAALALLALLGALQYFLFRRMRRVFNPALLAATVLVLVFLTWALIGFSGASADLRGAKEDAFDSIGVLERARADAYDANGDESRWLLDRQLANFYERAFNEKADRVAQHTDGRSDDDFLNVVKQQSKAPDGFKGYLASELSNVTFPGEKDAAVEALHMFLVYRKIDGAIRRLEAEGKHAAALALCVGTKPDESNGTFTKFDEALTKTLDINRKEFTKFLERAKSDLQGRQAVGPLVIGLAVAVLTFVGLRPRLKEYSLN